MYYIFKLILPSFIKRKLIPKSLLSRFVLIIIIPTLIGQFFALHLFYERHWYNVSYHTSSLIITEIESLLQQKELYKNKNQVKKYLNLSYILLPNQTITSNNLNKAEELEILKKQLENKISYQTNISVDENGKISILIQIHKDIISITLPAKILLNPTTSIFVLWVIFLTILLLTVSLIFSKNQIKSILELTNAAEKYGRGEKMDNYKPSGAREIRRAGLAFIKMKDRIERQTSRRTQMLAMISHDLNTPLTRMKLQVELMSNSDEKEELNHDINSMQHMISSYLDFAKGEGGEVFVKIELNNWVRKYLKLSWNFANIQILAKEKEIYTQIKPHSFSRALSNIISNAIKYSTKIKISVYSHNEEAIITIEDNGKGIDEDEKIHVFKPFYRGNKARTLKDSSNVGLGLAITKEIINGHYGSIKLEKSKELKGLLVRIKIPKLINK
jgi:two-component system osmolarity sensor histidine kinase EnvZ